MHKKYCISSEEVLAEIRLENKMERYLTVPLISQFSNEVLRLSVHHTYCMPFSNKTLTIHIRRSPLFDDPQENDEADDQQSTSSTSHSRQPSRNVSYWTGFGGR